MDGNVQQLLNRVSLVSAIVATLAVLYLFSHTSTSCRNISTSHDRHHSLDSSTTLSGTPFPLSSCESAARRVIPPDARSRKLRSTPAYHIRTDALSASVFVPLRNAGLLSNHSRVLCVSAGTGHEVDALLGSGVRDVTGVDVVDFPPLVRRADPHNLPFFDGVFDLAFSAGLDWALFPTRFAAEMERTVRKGGACAVAIVRRESGEEVTAVTRLFKKSGLVEVRNFSLGGDDMTLLTMRNIGVPP